MNNFNRFSGKVAFIQGGSRGIGAAIVERLALEGASVAFTFVSSHEKAKAIAENLTSQGSKVIAIKADSPLLANKVLSVSSFSKPRAGIYSAARKTQVVHSPFDTEIDVDRTVMRQRLVDELAVPPETQLT